MTTNHGGRRIPTHHLSPNRPPMAIILLPHKHTMDRMAATAFTMGLHSAPPTMTTTMAIPRTLPLPPHHPFIPTLTLIPTSRFGQNPKCSPNHRESPPTTPRLDPFGTLQIPIPFHRHCHSNPLEAIPVIPPIHAATKRLNLLILEMLHHRERATLDPLVPNQ